MRELERCVKELGLAGVQIGSTCERHEPGRCRSCSRCSKPPSELGAAVFVHPWDMLGKERMQQILDTLAGGHAGGDLIGRMLA